MDCPTQERHKIKVCFAVLEFNTLNFLFFKLQVLENIVKNGKCYTFLPSIVNTLMSDPRTDKDRATCKCMLSGQDRATCKCMLCGHFIQQGPF